MADEDFLCNDEATASNHTSVVVALIVLEGTGFGLGALFIFACCCQLVFIDKLKNLWQIIQFQVWRNPESGFSLFYGKSNGSQVFTTRDTLTSFFVFFRFVYKYSSGQY